MLLQDAAHPNVGGGLEVGAANGLADEVLGLANAGGGVDEYEAMTKPAMQEHRDCGERFALIADHVVGADILLANVKLMLAAHPPVALAGAHVGEKS